jgi:hypothetical protein
VDGFASAQGDPARAIKLMIAAACCQAEAMVATPARTRPEAAESQCSTILVDSPNSANAGTAGRLRGFHVTVQL